MVVVGGWVGWGGGGGGGGRGVFLGLTCSPVPCSAPPRRPLPLPPPPPPSETRHQYYHHTVQLYKVAGRKQVALGQQVCSLAALLPHSLMLGYDFHFFNYEPLLKVSKQPMPSLFLPSPKLFFLL